MKKPMESHNMLGMRLDYVTPEEGSTAIAEYAKGGRGGYCCVPNVHMCIETLDDHHFRDVVNGSMLTWSDSTILQKARALRYGIDMPRVLKGSDMMLALLQIAVEQDLVVGLYGSGQPTIENLKMKMPRQFPGLKLAYTYSPPFRKLSEQEDKTIVDDLAKAGVQLLFVGLGCPKQECWMASHTDQLPDTMMIGVGAAFDFNAGTVAPSPAFVHKYGLEWLYRLFAEPKRLARRYLSTSPRFVVLMTWDGIKSKFSDQTSNT